MSPERPRLSFEPALERRLRAALEGVAPDQYVECLRRLAQASLTNREKVFARMATNAALAEAVRDRMPEEVEQLISERRSLGFESATDCVFSFQPVVVAALERRELLEAAKLVLAEIEGEANQADGLERTNARLFTSRMRKRLGPSSRRTR